MTGAQPQILIVCSGNICRSPYAEAALRTALAMRSIPSEVRSCGTAALEGEPATSTVVRLARTQGVDLRRHRAQQVSVALLRTADLVLAVTARHANQLRQQAPAARVTTLRAAARRSTMLAQRELTVDQWFDRLVGAYEAPAPYDDSGLDDIDDPFGGGRREYQRMIVEVDDAVAGLVGGWPTATAHPSEQLDVGQ